MNLATADRGKLAALLAELAGAVEELLLSGLTTASESTRRVLDASFQEASRLRLLRLGSTLRAAGEELTRFTRNDTTFSARRLVFFLSRAWMLSRGLARALQAGDDEGFERLLRTPAGRPAARLEVVTLGVLKKVVPGSFCAFEFRLRSLPEGSPLVWSCVFPLKPGNAIPAEAFLHLPHKQQFKAITFLEGKSVILEKVTVTGDGSAGRVTLAPDSTVTAGAPFADWGRFQGWDPAAALARLRAHEPGPFDLDVELQEEVVLHDWQVGEPSAGEEGLVVYPVTAGAEFDAVAPAGEDGKALRQALERLGKEKARPPLFGLLHYEKCRLALQPLAVFGDNGPEQLMISAEKVDRAALVKALKF
jgi:hypothetical protein